MNNPLAGTLHLISVVQIQKNTKTVPLTRYGSGVFYSSTAVLQPQAGDVDGQQPSQGHENVAQGQGFQPGLHIESHAVGIDPESGEYKSGQELSLTAIAEQLGISRTPVREAFQTLAAEGLITLRMSKGAIVNKIDQKFIKDTFEMRILLESTAAWKAAENGLPDADDYIAKLKDMEAHLDTIDDKAYEDLNQAIHMAIWEAADNQKLSNYLMELWNGPSTGHAIPEEQKHYRLSTEEHIQLLEYIRDHKPEEAKEAMARHIQRSEENVLAYLAKKEA